MENIEALNLGKSTLIQHCNNGGQLLGFNNSLIPPLFAFVILLKHRIRFHLYLQKLGAS